MIKLTELVAMLHCRALVRGVDEVPAGHLRIETTFKYPDGGSIEVFVVNEGGLTPPRILSDLGQTTAWLLDMQIKPWLSPKRAAFVEDILHVLGVRQTGGALEMHFASLDEIEPKMVVLAQACLRVADLTFTRRASLQSTFSEDLEEVLMDNDLAFEQNAELPGKYAPVRLDYLIHRDGHDTALMGWSSGSSTQAHIVSNEIFRKWHDLEVPRTKVPRVTVFDDRYDIYRPDDMDRIRNYSDLFAFSDRPTLSQALSP